MVSCKLTRIYYINFILSSDTHRPLILCFLISPGRRCKQISQFTSKQMRLKLECTAIKEDIKAGSRRLFSHDFSLTFDLACDLGCTSSKCCFYHRKPSSSARKPSTRAGSLSNPSASARFLGRPVVWTAAPGQRSQLVPPSFLNSHYSSGAHSCQSRCPRRSRVVERRRIAFPAAGNRQEIDPREDSDEAGDVERLKNTWGRCCCSGSRFEFDSCLSKKGQTASVLLDTGRRRGISEASCITCQTPDQ